MAAVPASADGAPHVPAGPVGYAIDRKRIMSATPSTPIGDVAGVGDMNLNLSLA
jgi:hypothetical protein